MHAPKIRPALTEPEWRNGRRAGFKIPYPSLGVWVRLPPSVLFSSAITDLQTCSEPRLIRGFRISGGASSEALLASEEFAAVVRASLRFSVFWARFGPVDGPENSSVPVAGCSNFPWRAEGSFNRKPQACAFALTALSDPSMPNARACGLRLNDLSFARKFCRTPVALIVSRS